MTIERGSQRAGEPILRIADVTSRDEQQLAQREVLLANHEQTEIWRSAALSTADRVRVGRQTAELGVDLIEVGFADCAADLDAARALSAELSSGGPIVSALAPVLGPATHITGAGEALSAAKRPRLHLFTSAAQMTEDRGRLLLSPDQLLGRVRSAVEVALAVTGDVEFSPPRTSVGMVEIAADCAQAAIEAGATTINVRNSEECADPVAYAAYLRELMRLLPDPDSVTFSADVFVSQLRGEEALDTALACAEAAIEQGCRQLKCAVHGTAATPGHVPLELLAFNVWARSQLDDGALRCGIDPTKLRAGCGVVADAKGYDVPASQPLVGAEGEIPWRVTRTAASSWRSLLA
jgi:2-isopropylmalate synthase